MMRLPHQGMRCKKGSSSSFSSPSVGRGGAGEAHHAHAVHDPPPALQLGEELVGRGGRPRQAYVQEGMRLAASAAAGKGSARALVRRGRRRPPFPPSLPRGSGVFGLDGVAKVPSENVLRRPRPEDPLCASTRRLASSTRREKRRRTSGSTAGFPAFLATLPGAPSIVGCTGRSLRKMQKQTNDVAACFAASAKPSRRPRSIRIWPVISCRKRSTSQYAS